MITPQDAHRICAESLCDMRTVTKAYGGAPITMASRQRIRAAAERLNLPPPPAPTARKRGAGA